MADIGEGGKRFFMSVYTESTKSSPVTALQDQKRGRQESPYVPTEQIHPILMTVSLGKATNRLENTLQLKIKSTWTSKSLLCSYKVEDGSFVTSCKHLWIFVGFFCVLFWNVPKVVENQSTTSFPNNEYPYCCWNLSRKVCKEKSLMMF